MTAITVPVVKLSHAQDLPLPSYATAMSAGMDLLAAIATDIILEPGARKRVPAGISIALPHGHEAQVRPRSGLAASDGITVLNSPGTIDADYRGEIAVILINLGNAPFRIERGMRIAQLVVAPVDAIAWREDKHLPASGRAAGGFGSTGVAEPRPERGGNG